MEPLLVVWVLIPVILLVVGGGLGKVVERRHRRSLVRREESLLREVTVTNLRSVPAGMVALDASLVVGEVVVASDYLKQFMAAARNLFGGEVRSLQGILARARREALLRAVEQARGQQADLLVNVRFATSAITPLASEVVCSATAVRTR